MKAARHVLRILLICWWSALRKVPLNGSAGSIPGREQRDEGRLAFEPALLVLLLTPVFFAPLPRSAPITTRAWRAAPLRNGCSRCSTCLIPPAERAR
jgi:hypothetical protein